MTIHDYVANRHSWWTYLVYAGMCFALAYYFNGLEIEVAQGHAAPEKVSNIVAILYYTHGIFGKYLYVVPFFLVGVAMVVASVHSLYSQFWFCIHRTFAPTFGDVIEADDEAEVSEEDDAEFEGEHLESTLYCEEWLYLKARAKSELSAESARARHAARRSYCVVIQYAEDRVQLVSVTADRIRVDFFDDLSRPDLIFEFQEAGAGRLFLSVATSLEYIEETQNLSRSVIRNYFGDGTVIITDRRIDDLEERKIHDNVDDNWVQYPDFGDYELLCWPGRVSH
ncbi:MAG: hypothetical protein ACI9G1_004130 [Pirellulaceae bacterium]|jgi:hypothetical protein